MLPSCPLLKPLKCTSAGILATSSAVKFITPTLSGLLSVYVLVLLFVASVTPPACFAASSVEIFEISDLTDSRSI